MEISEKDRQRFESKINKTDDCWLWTDYLDKYGYGQITIKGKTLTAHRFSYLLNGGVIPEGHVVRHKCKTKNCVNPQHLESGTQIDNERDKIRDGTSNRGRTQKLTETHVREIRLSNKTCIELGKIYNVSFQTISDIKRRLRWGWLKEL